MGLEVKKQRLKQTRVEHEETNFELGPLCHEVRFYFDTGRPWERMSSLRLIPPLEGLGSDVLWTLGLPMLTRHCSQNFCKLSVSNAGSRRAWKGSVSTRHGPSRPGWSPLCRGSEMRDPEAGWITTLQTSSADL